MQRANSPDLIDTAHGGARPEHQEWQGKWYTKDELESICGLGEVTGLCGANCYHDYYPVVPGISEPTYTPEQIEEFNRKENEPVEYNGKTYTKYEATQRQRKLETTMRAQRQEIKLLKEGGANEDDLIAARSRYRGTSAEYARFSKAMDLPQQRERVTVDGLGNIGVGKWTQDLTEKNYNDIIDMKGKMSDYKVRKWYDYHDKRIGELLDRSQSLEAQAHQAHSLRNQYKFQARELMADQEKRKLLDKKYPLNDFQYYYEKYSKQYGKDDDIYKAIIGSSMRPNKKVNKQYGLE